MTETLKPAPARTIVTGDTRPELPRHIKLRHDPGRGRWIILAPERVFNPDETAVAVLKLCDGHRCVSEIAETLSREYQAPLDEITSDILTMLQDLSDKGVVKAS
ncbi:MAG TPA: pyrroloquinoline quinone biosynthesis peptide chaperone PqqD [Hyphomicrobiaceae bacterium]|nr:pyrroloquinoline quinone biosynthesis peptide chaperone PqqD [Hyphomicrobiaceae bacterium]